MIECVCRCTIMFLMCRTSRLCSLSSLVCTFLYSFFKHLRFLSSSSKQFVQQNKTICTCSLLFQLFCAVNSDAKNILSAPNKKTTRAADCASKMSQNRDIFGSVNHGTYRIKFNQLFMPLNFIRNLSKYHSQLRNKKESKLF